MSGAVPSRARRAMMVLYVFTTEINPNTRTSAEDLSDDSKRRSPCGSRGGGEVGESVCSQVSTTYAQDRR